MVRFAADREKLEVLFDIYARINSTYADVKALLTQIIESATELTEGEASSLMLVNPENNKLYFEIALGPKGPSVKQYSVNMGEGIAGWVAEKNTSLIVNDVQNDARFFPEIARKIGFPTSSILAVPMRVKDKLVGVIEIINKRGGKKFTEEDLQWLEMFSTQAAIAVQNARSYQKVRNELSALQDKVQAGEGWHTFVGESRIIKDRLEIARKAAETDSSVLLLGESGVGKELFAEQIHLASPRRAGPFIRVNCAAIPEALLESELFGHVQGRLHRRRRRQARHVSSWPTAARSSWTRSPTCRCPCRRSSCACSRTGRSSGWERASPSSVNVRIIAATNRDLEQQVAARAVPLGPVLPPERASRSRSRPCASGARTFRRWRSSSCESTRGKPRSRSPGSPTRPWRCSCPTAGRGTSGSWRTPWNGRWCLPGTSKIRPDALTLASGTAAGDGAVLGEDPAGGIEYLQETLYHEGTGSQRVAPDEDSEGPGYPEKLPVQAREGTRAS